MTMPAAQLPTGAETPDQLRLTPWTAPTAKRNEDPLLVRNRKEARVAETVITETDLVFSVQARYLLADVVRRDTGEELTIPFPAGAFWPGEAAVLEMGLDLRGLRAVAGSQYQAVAGSGRQIELGTAHIDSLVMVRSHGPSRAAWLLSRTGVDLRENNNEISGLIVNGTRKNYRNRDQHFPAELGTPNEDGRTRNRQLPGPDVQEAFVVLSGVVVIEGEIPIPLTAGMAWPGTLPLGATDAIVQPCNSWMASGTTTGPWLSRGDVEAGAALVTAVMLSRMDNRECVRLIGPQMCTMSLESNAGIIGASPDNLRRIMTTLQRSQELGWQSFSVQEG